MLSLAAVLWLAPFAVSAPPASIGEIQISARLVDPEGKAVALARVRCSLKGTVAAGERNLVGREKTDAEGRLAWSAEGELFRQGPVALELLIERPDGDALLVTRLLPEPAEGKLDLGETTLQRAPVVVFGRVLDPAGRPAPNEAVEFSGIRQSPEPPGAPPLDARFMHGRLKTDAQGRFELRGLDRGLGRSTKREVRACSLVFPRTRWLPFGGSEAEIVLQFAEPAFVKGRVAVPEGVDPSAFRIEGSYEGELPLLGDSCTAARPERDGSFTLCFAAEPCTLALWVDVRSQHLGGFFQPPDFVQSGVVPDQDTVDWDLRNSLHVYDLVVLTPDGKPAESPDLFYSSGGKSVFRPFHGQQAPRAHRILSLDHPLPVRVEEEGFRNASTTLNGPQGELKLAPGIAVEIAVTNLPDLGEGGFLSLEISRGDGPNPKARGTIDRHGSGQVIAPEPGLYEILVVHQRHVGASIWSGVASWWTSMPKLDVYDRESQTKKLTLPDSLVEALRRDVEQHR